MRLLEKESANKVNFRLRDFAEEYNNTQSQQARDNLIDEFIDGFLKSYGIEQLDVVPLGFRNALHNKLEVEGGKGLKTSNPLMQWIVNFFDAGGNLTDINDAQFNNLINLVGQSIILDKDLRGNGVAGKESIIFNQDFYNYPLDSMKYLAQLYYWLSSEPNIKSLNLNNLRSKQIYEFFDILGDKELARKATTYMNLNRGRSEDKPSFSEVYLKDNNLRDLLLFQDGKFSSNGKLRDPKRLYAAMDYLDENKNGSDEELETDSRDIRRREIDPRKEDIYKKMGLDKLNQEQARDLIAYLTKKNNINL